MAALRSVAKMRVHDQQLTLAPSNHLSCATQRTSLLLLVDLVNFATGMLGLYTLLLVVFSVGGGMHIQPRSQLIDKIFL